MSQVITEIDPILYAEFVAKLSLARIRLAGCEISTNISMLKPKEIETKLEQSNSFTTQLLEIQKSIVFRQCSNIIFVEQSSKKELARISVTYELEYHLDWDDKLSENLEIFLNVFEQHNLPLNAYPFLREFVHNMMGRMNYPILTLPLLQPDLPNPHK